MLLMRLTQFFWLMCAGLARHVSHTLREQRKEVFSSEQSHVVEPQCCMQEMTSRALDFCFVVQLHLRPNFSQPFQAAWTRAQAMT